MVGWCLHRVYDTTVQQSIPHQVWLVRSGSACFAVAIAPGIWEIGGLWTDPSQRRLGLARRVTITALAELARRGVRPRYQAHESNHASLCLAESVGLVPCVLAEHYLGRTV
ncbi:MAG: hypothetical protein Fur005_30500 [Roseiflexaceae bacterium]